jgi:hypothetical protein
MENGNFNSLLLTPYQERVRQLEMVESELHNKREQIRIPGEIRAIDKELRRISEEKRRIAEQILEDRYPLIQEETQAQFQQTLSIIESAWSALQRLDQEAGGALLKGSHFNGLKILFMQPTRVLRVALEKWI